MQTFTLTIRRYTIRFHSRRGLHGELPDHHILAAGSRGLTSAFAATIRVFSVHGPIAFFDRPPATLSHPAPGEERAATGSATLLRQFLLEAPAD